MPSRLQQLIERRAQERSHAGAVRSDAGPIQERGTLAGGRQDAGREDLQRDAQAGRGASDRQPGTVPPDHGEPRHEKAQVASRASLERLRAKLSSAPAKPLHRIKVRRVAVDEAGNKIGTVKQRADLALKDIDDEIATMREVIQCQQS